MENLTKFVELRVLRNKTYYREPKECFNVPLPLILSYVLIQQTILIVIYHKLKRSLIYFLCTYTSTAFKITDITIVYTEQQPFRTWEEKNEQDNHSGVPSVLTRGILHHCTVVFVSYCELDLLVPWTWILKNFEALSEMYTRSVGVNPWKQVILYSIYITMKSDEYSFMLREMVSEYLSCIKCLEVTIPLASGDVFFGRQYGSVIQWKWVTGPTGSDFPPDYVEQNLSIWVSLLYI